MKTIIGYILIAIPFIAILIFGAYLVGWRIIIPFLLTGIIVICVGFGVKLISN